MPALQGWRREVFGEQALKLVRGEIALKFEKPASWSVRDAAITIAGRAFANRRRWRLAVWPSAMLGATPPRPPAPGSAR